MVHAMKKLFQLKMQVGTLIRQHYCLMLANVAACSSSPNPKNQLVRYPYRETIRNNDKCVIVFLRPMRKHLTSMRSSYITEWSGTKATVTEKQINIAIYKTKTFVNFLKR